MIFGEVQVIDHLVVDEFTADTWLINIFIHIGRGRFERHVSPIAHKVESIQRSQKFCFRNQWLQTFISLVILHTLDSFDGIVGTFDSGIIALPYTIYPRVGAGQFIMGDVASSFVGG